MLKKINNLENKIDLNNKVDEFIKWYHINMLNEYHSDKEKEIQSRKVREFIEMMAIWYGLKYCEYEINKLDIASYQTSGKILKNESVYKLFSELLPFDKKYIFINPEYEKIVYVDKFDYLAHFHLTSNGIIKLAHGIDLLPGNNNEKKLSNEYFKGKHIKEAIKIMKERKIYLPEENEIEKMINSYDNCIYLKEEILNCIMYRIIERGGNIIGPRQGLLFAKQFKRNIAIPMIYGIDQNDPNLKKFIYEYLEMGGLKDLECYVNYFKRKYEKVSTVNLQELIKTKDDTLEKRKIKKY